MRSIKHMELSEELIERLSSHFEEKKFKVDQEVIYRGHIPSIGVLLLDGHIIANNTRTSFEYDKGSLLGVKELIEGNPFKYTVKIKSGSKFLILDRSSLIELSLSKDKMCQKIYTEIIE